MNILHTQWLSDELVEVITEGRAQGGGQPAPQAGQTKGAAVLPFPTAAKPTTAQLDRIEAHARKQVGTVWDGQWEPWSNDLGSGGFSDRSDADFHVCAVIARLALDTGIDPAHLPEAIEEVFGRSALAERDKWQNRTDYRDRTIGNAIKAVTKERTPREQGGEVSQGGGEEWPEHDEVSFSLPPVPPFDTERMLPPALAGYVVDQSDLMQTPPEAIAAPLLVAMGAALGSGVGILPKRHDGSWKVSGGNLWGFVCASPGRMKSETVSRGLAPLKALERELATRNKAKRDQYEVDKVRYEMEQATFKREIKNGTQGVPVPQPPEEPQDERLIVVDATVAKLGAICAASPRGVLVERDEMTGLLSQLGAVGHEGDREFFLTGWSGETGFKVDRIGRGSLVIPRLILSLFGGIQPGKLANYVREATRGGVGADGLLPRFQIAVYPDYDRTFRNVDRPHDLAAQAAAFDAAKRLSEIDPTAIGAKPLVGVEGHYLQFTNEGQDLFDKWREPLEKLIRNGDLHPAIESHYAKYRSLIPKLALIFHLVSDGAGPVTVGALVMAIRWGNFLKEHAKRIYAGAIHGADLATKALADRIKAGKVPSPFKSRDIYRAGWAGLSDKEDADLAIVGLLEAGWLRKEQTTGTGRTTAQYWINPKVARKV